MDQITPCKGDVNFHEETILFTPLPQATSTVDKRPDLLPLPEVMMDPEVNTPDSKNGYLSDGILAINELRQKLDIFTSNKTSVDPLNNFIANQTPQENVNKINVNENAVGIPEHESKASNLRNSSKHLIQVADYAVKSNGNAPKSDVSLNNYSISNSLPVPALANCEMNASQQLTNLSLPVANVGKEKLPDLAPLVTSSFRPLPLVPDEIRRKAHKLDVFSSVEEAERSSAREKALKIINTLDLVPAIEPNCSSSSVQNTLHKSSEPSICKDDMSGFSQLMNESDFKKDESWCAANFGYPIKPGEESFSFLSTSQVSLDFMPPDDSLFAELGPADPPKLNRSNLTNLNFSSVSDSNYRHLKPDETPKSMTYVKSEKMRESSRNVKDLFSELDSSVCSSIVPADLDEYLKDKNICIEPGRSTLNELKPMDDSSSELRVSDIAKALQDVPIDATPNSLAKRVMELSDRPSTEKSYQGYNECEQCFYEKTVVYGGLVHVDLKSDTLSPQTLWSFQDLMPSQVRAVIKSSSLPVKVLLFPLVRKKLVIKVQEVEFDRNERYFARLHVIRLTVENPKLEVVGGSELDFTLVPECGLVSLPLTLRCNNSNVLVICPRFEQEKLGLFSVGYEGENDEEVHLPPKQDVVIRVIFKPSRGFCEDLSKVKHIVEQLNLCLSPMLGSEVLMKVNLKASVYHCSLQVRANLLEEPFSPGEDRQVYLKNNSPCGINMKLQICGRFSVSSSSIMLKPLEVSSVIVSYCPPTDADMMEGKLIMSVVPGDLDYEIGLRGRGCQVNSSFYNAPDSSRSSSALGSVNSTMSMNSSSEPDGPLQLECTSAFLVWSSMKLGGTSTIKSFCIRSKGSCKEKLCIEINDPSNSFFLITNERESKKSDVVVLNPRERKEISVEFSPKLLGQLKASMIIRRVKTNFDSDSKKVLMFGFGGRGNLRALNIAMDLVTRQCALTLGPNFTQQFALQNIGDGLVFFDLSQKKLEGMHLTVSPLRGLIGPGEVRTVNLTLQTDTVGSEHTFFQQLLNKDKCTDIVLSSLTILYGDESTRLRLARLYVKHRNKPQFQKIPQVISTLKSLSDLFPVNQQKMELVSSLKDPLTSLLDLFNEGIQELTIDVITPRKCIEEANLEVTQQFINFPEHSQLDETEFTTFLDITNLPSHINFK